MNNATATAPRAWQVFVHGRKSGPAFATVANASDEHDALKQIKTRLNGSPEDYDRDGLAPALIALPAPPARREKTTATTG